MNDDVKIDANQVKALREARGWSQEQLAAVSELSARTIQRLEAEGKASGESRMAVAAAFGIEPARLAVAGVAQGAARPAHTKTMDPADRVKIMLWIVSIVLVVVMFQVLFGYRMGKDAAERDNWRNEQCAANPESEPCRR